MVLLAKQQEHHLPLAKRQNYIREAGQLLGKQQNYIREAEVSCCKAAFVESEAFEYRFY